MNYFCSVPEALQNPTTKQESSRCRERFSFLEVVSTKNFADFQVHQEKRIRFNMSLFFYYSFCFIPYIVVYIDTYNLSFNQFCCFYSINHHCVVLNMEDIYPSFVVRHHVPCLRVYATHIGISADAIEVGEDGK